MVARRRVLVSSTTVGPEAVLARRIANSLRIRGLPAVTGFDVGGEHTDVLVLLSNAAAAAGQVIRTLETASGRQLYVLPLDNLDLAPLRGLLAGAQTIPSHDNLADQLGAVADALRVRMPVTPETAELIDDKTNGFVGRDYVFDAIDDFVSGHERGHFVLVGEPGEGKTAILAEYARRNGCIAHFNQRSKGINTTRRFVDSVGWQLAERQAIPAPLATIDPGRFGEVITRMLTEARAAMPADVPLVVVVDALDEADQDTEPQANVLSLPELLPKGVFLIASCRPVEAGMPLLVDGPNLLFDLAHHRDAATGDVRRYLDQMVSRDRLRQWCAARSYSPTYFIDTLVDKSRCNFMYLRHVLPQLNDGYYQNLDIAGLPVGLQKYYEDHWRLKDMTARTSPQVKVWTIYLLCELQKPVSVELLAHIFGRVQAEADVSEVAAALDEWHPFLSHDTSSVPALFSLYHASFRDFLHRQQTVADTLLTLPDVNAVISDVLWEYEFGKGAMS